MWGRLASVLFLVASIGCTAPRYSSAPSPAARPADIAFDPALVETARAPVGRTALAAQPAAASAIAEKMRVHFINVGQGAATLFEFPAGAVLVDAGGETNPSFDSKAELDAYLAEFFVRRDDLDGSLTSLILTHPHRDHTEGVPVVLSRYAPKNIVTNGQTYGSGSAQQKLAHAYAIQHEASVDFQAVRRNERARRGRVSRWAPRLDQRHDA